MSIQIRDIIIVAAAFFLLLSLGVNFMQFAQTQQMGQELKGLNDSYVLNLGENANLQKQISAHEARIADLQAVVAGLGEKLNQTQKELDAQTAEKEKTEQQLQETMTEVSRREEQLLEQKAALQNLSEEFKELQISLNQSMSWFRNNANLPTQTNWNAKNLAERAADDCVDGDRLNLACINHVLERTATITYRTDTDNQSRETDHLQSVEETFLAGSGDCEDYSLLLKAVLNTMRERGDYRLVAWKVAQSGEFRVYPKESLTDAERYWYYPNAARQEIGALSSERVWVICYPTNQGSGHCTVAVGGRGVEGVQTIPDLTGARVFEPQNGRYLGQIGSEFAVCEPQTNPYCWAMPNVIVTIIGDNDMYRVHGRQWNGYSMLYQRIEREKGAAACTDCGAYN